jgi:hypothetical protein
MKTSKVPIEQGGPLRYAHYAQAAQSALATWRAKRSSAQAKATPAKASSPAQARRIEPTVRMPRAAAQPVAFDPNRWAHLGTPQARESWRRMQEQHAERLAEEQARRAERNASRQHTDTTRLAAKILTAARHEAGAKF